MDNHPPFQTLAEIEAYYEQQMQELHKQSRDIINTIRLLAEFVGMPFDESLLDDLNKLQKMSRTNTPA